MTFLADTHGLVWHLTDDKRLGKQAKELFLQAESQQNSIILPTIVLVEAEAVSRKLGYKNQFDQALQVLKKGSYFPVYPFDEKILEVYWTITSTLEIHDRIIVATAKVTNSTIITRDTKIRKAKGVKTVW